MGLRVIKECEEEKREEKRKLDLPLTSHRTLPLPVDTALSPAFHALDFSVKSMPTGNVDRLPSLRSRNQSMTGPSCNLLSSKFYLKYVIHRFATHTVLVMH